MKKFYFTFGHGQNPGIGYYYIVEAETEFEARKIMNDRFQGKWAFCYNSEEAAGVKEFNLKRIR